MKSNVTFGVNSVGNGEGLCLCLASVLNSHYAPAVIQIRFEGEIPQFATFYLEQLSSLAKILGVEWQMYVDNSKGVRAARDWQVENCPTQFLWMGDDDVIYSFDCLAHFAGALKNVGEDFLYCAGIKVDVSNRRGYKDYDTEIYDRFPLDPPLSSLNHFYFKDLFDHQIFPFTELDSGNCIINVQEADRIGAKFSVFADSENSGGEDTIFAAYGAHLGGKGYAAPSAQSIHLEKPKVVFDEFSARKELVKRSIDLIKRNL